MMDNSLDKQERSKKMEEVWARYYKNAQAQQTKTKTISNASNINIMQDKGSMVKKDDGAESTSLKHGRLTIVAPVDDGKDTSLKTLQNASTLFNTSHAALATKSKSIDSKDTVAVDEGEKLIDISTDDDEKTTTTEEDEEEMKTLVDIWFEQHRKKRAAAVAAKEKAKEIQ